ncbi:hypothetical protein IG631_17420 [Alternaria alternata]|nr:hypothetical protein IG631_17420 [Alternaria alternata]
MNARRSQPLPAATIASILVKQMAASTTLDPSYCYYTQGFTIEFSFNTRYHQQSHTSADDHRPPAPCIPVSFFVPSAETTPRPLRMCSLTWSRHAFPVHLPSLTAQALLPPPTILPYLVRKPP